MSRDVSLDSRPASGRELVPYSRPAPITAPSRTDAAERVEDLVPRIPGVQLGAALTGFEAMFTAIEDAFEAWWGVAQLGNQERDLLSRTSKLGALAAFEKGWLDARDQPAIAHARTGFRNWRSTDNYHDAFGDEEEDAARHAYAAGFSAQHVRAITKERS